MRFLASYNGFVIFKCITYMYKLYRNVYMYMHVYVTTRFKTRPALKPATGFKAGRPAVKPVNRF